MWRLVCLEGGIVGQREQGRFEGCLKQRKGNAQKLGPGQGISGPYHCWSLHLEAVSHGEVSGGTFGGTTPNSRFLGHPAKWSPSRGDLGEVLVFLGVSEHQVSCFQCPKTYLHPPSQSSERGFSCSLGLDGSLIKRMMLLLPNPRNPSFLPPGKRLGLSLCHKVCQLSAHPQLESHLGPPAVPLCFAGVLE